MQPRNGARQSGRARSGKTLVVFVLVCPVLIGMLGLIIDTGMLMAAQRQVQNTADSAAMAAAMDLFRGANSNTALATAQTFVTDNGLSGTLTLNGGNTTNTLNIPPQITTVAEHQTTKYAEVVVSQTVKTLFIQILGFSSSNTVSARAVAGFEQVGAGGGVFVLDPGALPGLAVDASTSLIVNGDITVNSQGGGIDQFGTLISNTTSAVKDGSSGSLIVTTTLNSVGGLDSISNVWTYDANFAPAYYDSSLTSHPVIARNLVAPDPYLSLVTPTTTSAGKYQVVNTPAAAWPQTISVSQSGSTINATGYNTTGSPNVFDPVSGTLTLNPGIYTSMSLTAGKTVFNPGIYVIKGGTFQVNNPAVVDASAGVLFYLTGRDSNTSYDYDPVSGAPDKNDGDNTPTPPNSTAFASVAINGGTVTLAPLNDSTSPFNKILFYQRRWNTQSDSVGGTATNPVQFSGTIYARWAGYSSKAGKDGFKLVGNATYNAQFVVGSMHIGGGASVFINATDYKAGIASLVFLVE